MNKKQRRTAINEVVALMDSGVVKKKITWQVASAGVVHEIPERAAIVLENGKNKLVAHFDADGNLRFHFSEERKDGGSNVIVCDPLSGEVLSR